jgi:hypothetical protein
MTDSWAMFVIGMIVGAVGMLILIRASGVEIGW